MVRKVTHLESYALSVFFGFVSFIETQVWFSGIEVSPATYKGKPTDGDRRSVTIWQGSKNNYHQRLEIHFFYNSDLGGWNLNGVIFAGSNNDLAGSDYEWSQAYKGGPKIDDPYTWVFVPVKFDGHHFIEYVLSDSQQNEEFELACRKRFQRTPVSAS